MKEDNKYYTPDFSEFHPGFEYESQGVKTQDGYIWHKKVWDGSNRNNAVVSCIEDSKIRVKHLDSEDVEELGFEWKDRYDRFQFKDTEWMMSLRGEYVIIAMFYGRDVLTFFNGKIRNKSELKRVLKQIGVL